MSSMFIHPIMLSVVEAVICFILLYLSFQAKKEETTTGHLALLGMVIGLCGGATLGAYGLIIAGGYAFLVIVGGVFLAAYSPKASS